MIHGNDERLNFLKAKPRIAPAMYDQGVIMLDPQKIVRRFNVADEVVEYQYHTADKVLVFRPEEIVHEEIFYLLIQKQ